jgi:hypothetical protein
MVVLVHNPYPIGCCKVGTRQPSLSAWHCNYNHLLVCSSGLSGIEHPTIRLAFVLTLTIYHVHVAHNWKMACTVAGYSWSPRHHLTYY